jgi:Uma2 family endonuclease
MSDLTMKTLAKWSIDEYHRMVEAGILCVHVVTPLEYRNVELLEGEIVEMSPETPIHYNTAKRGAKYLVQFVRSIKAEGRKK